MALLPWTFGMCIPITLAFLLSDRLGHRVHRTWARVTLWLVGIRVETLFENQIPTEGGVLFAPNHESLWDIPVISSLPYPFKWVSKYEVRRVPLMGWSMVAMGCFFVKRSGTTRDLNVMKDVEQGLHNGKYVVIFPEGTRTRTGELLPLKKGAFRTAQNAGVPLVPVAIHGTFSIAPPYKIPQHRGHRVTVRFGQPLRWSASTEVTAAMDDYRKALERLLAEARSSETISWS